MVDSTCHHFITLAVSLTLLSQLPGDVKDRNHERQIVGSVIYFSLPYCRDGLSIFVRQGLLWLIMSVQAFLYTWRFQKTCNISQCNQPSSDQVVILGDFTHSCSCYMLCLGRQ